MPRCSASATTSASHSRWRSWSARSTGSWASSPATTTTESRPAGRPGSLPDRRSILPRALSRDRVTELAQEGGERDQGQPRDRGVIGRLDLLEKDDPPLLELVAPGTIDG